MSVASETDVQAAAEAEAAAAAGNNPVLLGLPTFIVGGIALGLFLLAYKPLGGATPVLATSIAAAGLGLVLATAWAIKIGAGAVAAVLGTFATFWLSLALQLLAIGATAQSDPVKALVTFVDGLTTFALVWTIVAAVLCLATLRLPSAYTVLIALVVVALLLVFLAFNGGGTSTGLLRFAGWVVMAFCLLGFYIFASAMAQALGGKGYPLGSAILK